MAIDISAVQSRVMDPFQNMLQSFRVGQQTARQDQQLDMAQQQIDLQRNEQLMKQQEAQAKQAEQQKMQAALGDFFSKDRTLDEHRQFRANFPQYADAIEESFKDKTAEQRNTAFMEASQIYSMIDSGRIDFAEEALDERIAAAENSGKADDAEMYREAKKFLSVDPDFTKRYIKDVMIGLDEGKAKLAFGEEDSTSKQKDYGFYAQQERDAGRVPLSFNEWDKQSKAAGATKVEVNTGSEIGTIPPGWEVFTDPETGARSMRPIAGGPAESKVEESAMAKAEKARTTVSSIDNVINTVNEAIGITGRGTAGFGSLLAKIPESSARDLDNMVTTIQANLGFDQLQSMRDSSPTGGALGQVSERELSFLQSTLANLDTKAKPETLKKNLEKVITHYRNWRGAVINARGQELMNQGMSQEQALEQLASEFPQ